MVKQPYDDYIVTSSDISTENAYQPQRSRKVAFKSSWIHLLPVALTFGILQLSFRNVYWGDAVAVPRVQLASLQVAAKVHETMILLSLSTMVLHYTRKVTVSPSGMSFGLLEAAYQSGLSGQPFSIGNWQALKNIFKNREIWNKTGNTKQNGSRIRVWHVVALLVCLAILALFVGPASAITMLPQLAWVPREDLIGPLGNRGRSARTSFSVYIPTQLFPSDVDGSSLPGTSCGDMNNDAGDACPWAGIAEIQASFMMPSKVAPLKRQNATIGNDTAVQRKLLLTQRPREKGGFSVAVNVPNFLLASFASLIRTPVQEGGNEYRSDSPFTLETVVNGGTPFSPLVGVSCRDNASDVFERSYYYELDGYNWNNQRERLLEDVSKIGTFDIRSVWNESELRQSSNKTEIRWKDITNVTGTPVLLGLFRHEGNVSVCSIQSSWTFTSQWVQSTASYDLTSNFTFEDTTSSSWASHLYGYPYSLNARKIHIHEEWAQNFNPTNGSTRLLESYLDCGIQSMQEVSTPKLKTPPSQGTNTTKETQAFAYQYLEATIAQLFAKAIANGLSRIGAAHSATHFTSQLSLTNLTICNEKTQWCSQGPWLRSAIMPIAIVANTSRDEALVSFGSQALPPASLDGTWFNNDSAIMRSFPMPENVNEIWTSVAFPIRRYGYTYTFSGIATYLATALLCFHAAIVIAHVIYRVGFDCDVFEFGESLGSLLCLAMGDRAPASTELWDTHVAVVARENQEGKMAYRLEMVEGRNGKVVFEDGREESLVGVEGQMVVKGRSGDR